MLIMDHWLLSLQLQTNHTTSADGSHCQNLSGWPQHLRYCLKKNKDGKKSPIFNTLVHEVMIGEESAVSNVTVIPSFKRTWSLKKKTGVEIRSSALSFLSRGDHKLKEWPKSHSSFPSRPAPDAFISDQIRCNLNIVSGKVLRRYHLAFGFAACRWHVQNHPLVSSFWDADKAQTVRRRGVGVSGEER